MAEFYGVQTGSAEALSDDDQGNQNLPEMRRQDLFRRAGRALPQMCPEKCAWQFPGRTVAGVADPGRPASAMPATAPDDRASASQHKTTAQRR